MLLVSFFPFFFFFFFFVVVVLVLKVVFIAACQMGSLLFTLKFISSFTQYWWPIQGVGDNTTGFIHIDGTRVSYVLSPQPLLKFAPPPKTKKINMEKEKETHKTGILWMQLNCTVSGQVQPANRGTANTHPSSWNSAPEPASSRPPRAAAPEGLLPQVTRGSRIWTDRLCDNSSREQALQWSLCQQLQVPSSSASDHLAIPERAQHMGLEAQLRQILPSTGRPSSSYLGLPRAQPALLQAS